MKKKRQNNTLDLFSAHFVKLVLDDPVYCGKLAYGRRKNEKIAGVCDQYHVVKQDDYPIYDGMSLGSLLKMHLGSLRSRSRRRACIISWIASTG